MIWRRKKRCFFFLLDSPFKFVNFIFIFLYPTTAAAAAAWRQWMGECVKTSRLLHIEERWCRCRRLCVIHGWSFASKFRIYLYSQLQPREGWATAAAAVGSNATQLTIPSRIRNRQHLSPAAQYKICYSKMEKTKSDQFLFCFYYLVFRWFICRPKFLIKLFTALLSDWFIQAERTANNQRITPLVRTFKKKTSYSICFLSVIYW